MPHGAYRTGNQRHSGQSTADEVLSGRPRPARTSSSGRTGAVDDDPPRQRDPHQAGLHRPGTEQGSMISRCIIWRNKHTANIRLRTIVTWVNVA